MYVWVVVALFRYDVFIFSFGQSLLLKNFDLPILKWFGKTVISNMGHGSEGRPAFIDGVYRSKEGLQSKLSFIEKRTKSNRKTVQFHELNTSFLIGSPYSTTHFSRSRLINFFAFGLPIRDLQSLIVNSAGLASIEQELINGVRILHAPSHAFGKGSSLVQSAINSLMAFGYKIDFVLLEGRPFSEVLFEIQKCNFVVDQVYSDTPMAGFAAEAAYFGKPAVVGGYRLTELSEFVPEDMWPPSKICHPDFLEQAIEELILDIELRERLGRQAREFVRRKWNATEVARRYMRLIQADIPEEWWLNPSDVSYLEGWGQTIEQTKEIICALVAEYGVQSLQLSQRPELEKDFLEFAGLNLRAMEDASRFSQG